MERYARPTLPHNLKLRYGQRSVELEYIKEDIPQKASFDMDSLNQNEDFFDIVRNHRLITIHSGETTLDDIFIQVTGVKLHE